MRRRFGVASRTGKCVVSGGDVRAAISWLREDSLGFTSQRVRKWLGVAGELQFDEAPRSDRRGAWVASVAVRYCLTFFYQLCRADLGVRDENDGGILIGKPIVQIRAELYEKPVVGHAHQPMGWTKTRRDEIVKYQ